MTPVSSQLVLPGRTSGYEKVFKFLFTTNPSNEILLELYYQQSKVNQNHIQSDSLECPTFQLNESDEI